MEDGIRKHSRRKRYWIIIIITLLLLVPTLVGLYHYLKRTPEGISVEGEVHQVDDIEFLYDLTYEGDDGNETHEQEIFEEVFTMIDEAEDFLVIDMFLFNDDYDHGNPELDFPALSMELALHLVDKKQNNPDMDIVFITDPLNSFYETYEPEHFQLMRDTGIHLFETDTAPLRDSNIIYTSFYRSYFQWLGSSESSWLPNALRPLGPEVNIRSYLSLLNFKANHRKLIINEQEGLVTSANPHDASVYHSNIGFKVRGDILDELLASERAVLDMADIDTSMFDDFTVQSDNEQGPYEVQLVTEKKVKDSMLKMINETEQGDNIKLGMFYLSDRDVIHSLKDAVERGVELQMILDVNQDAFGNEKNGIPNRPVAAEFMNMEEPPEVRWYESHGEQYHAKFLIIETEEELSITAGSSNFTRRNLQDYNLETNLIVRGPKGEAEVEEILGYYDMIWDNEDGIYTADYDKYAEDSTWKTILYRIQEASGLSTF